MDMRLGVPQNRSRRYGEERILFSANNQTLAVQLVARRYADWAILTANKSRINIYKCIVYSSIAVQTTMSAVI
jgi:hypothetical protein